MSASKNEKRYAYLDGWRGLSIVAVLAGHFLSVHGFNSGRFGVEMFFVLSGRLMAEILFIKQVSLPIFFQRRIARVWPALFIFIIAMWLLFGASESDLKVNTLSVLSTLTFTYNYYSLNAGYTQVLDHIWSLCIEEHTYILLAVIAYFSRKYHFNPVKLLLAICVICLLNGAFLTFCEHLDYYHTYWRSDTRSASILIGALCFLLMNRSTFNFHPLTALFFAGLALMLNTNPIPDPMKYSAGTLCIAIAMCTLKDLPERFMNILCHPWLTRIGLISFSLYLWQQPFYKMIAHGENKLVLFTAAVLIATLSYHIIEVPCRSWLNTLSFKIKQS